MRMWRKNLWVRNQQKSQTICDTANVMYMLNCVLWKQNIYSEFTNIFISHEYRLNLCTSNKRTTYLFSSQFLMEMKRWHCIKPTGSVLIIVVFILLIVPCLHRLPITLQVFTSLVCRVWSGFLSFLDFDSIKLIMKAFMQNKYCV